VYSFVSVPAKICLQKPVCEGGKEIVLAIRKIVQELRDKQVSALPAVCGINETSNWDECLGKTSNWNEWFGKTS
jgi:hypothetical protein